MPTHSQETGLPMRMASLTRTEDKVTIVVSAGSHLPRGPISLLWMLPNTEVPKIVVAVRKSTVSTHDAHQAKRLPSWSVPNSSFNFLSLEYCEKLTNVPNARKVIWTFQSQPIQQSQDWIQTASELPGIGFHATAWSTPVNQRSWQSKRGRMPGGLPFRSPTLRHRLPASGFRQTETRWTWADKTMDSSWEQAGQACLSL